MKAFAKTLIGMAYITLLACSNQQTKQENTAATIPEKPSPETNIPVPSNGSQNPPMTTTKNGKTLNLVRVMDGAVCKNDLEGVKGVFLIYANPEDIERIKKEQGNKIFSTFESKIQLFSEQALQQAADSTNLSKDPFAIGEDTERQKLAQQLSQNFSNAAADPIKKFQQETSLELDISTYIPSLMFFQSGCAIGLEEPESPEPNDPTVGTH